MLGGRLHLQRVDLRNSTRGAPGDSVRRKLGAHKAGVELGNPASLGSVPMPVEACERDRELGLGPLPEKRPRRGDGAKRDMSNRLLTGV